MTLFSCPLCCEEKFEDTKSLADHLSTVYKHLRCPLCEIRFDNLMVMIRHLERGCLVRKVDPDTESNQTLPNAENPADTTEEGEDIEMIGSLSAEESADEVTKKTPTANGTKEMVAETISEDQYLDKEGVLYKRRVVKIANLWSDLESGKVEDAEDNSVAIRPATSKSGASECPLCGKAVKGEYSLRLHLETAHEKETHPCCYCTRVFASSHQLQKHVGERHSMPYSCVYCNKPFNNLLMAKKHVQCHKSSRKPSYRCELCSETAHTNTEMKRHYREKHLVQLKPRDAPTPIAPYKKGSLWYEWHGYTYHQTHTTRAGVQALRCWVDGCWAEVRVPVIGQVMLQGEHTHVAHTWLKQRNELYNSLRRRCTTETTPIRIIYDEEALRYPEGAKNLIFPEATMRLWQKRLIQKMENPTSLEITLEDAVEWGEETNPQDDAMENEEEPPISHKRKLSGEEESED